MDPGRGGPGFACVDAFAHVDADDPGGRTAAGIIGVCGSAVALQRPPVAVVVAPVRRKRPS
ncbi:hypothetical protein GCM10010230_50490 [Streptomyces narbonensis]|nr:hypothetical protein GCM10010230_50490 [Streptomyces narbonensis]